MSRLGREPDISDREDEVVPVAITRSVSRKMRLGQVVSRWLPIGILSSRVAAAAAGNRLWVLGGQASQALQPPAVLLPALLEVHLSSPHRCSVCPHLTPNPGFAKHPRTPQVS